MIRVKGEVEGKKYEEPFSKGILARSLNVADIGSEKAYSIATDIESYLDEKNVNSISVEDLTNVVIEFLKEKYPTFATKYVKWRTIRKSREPLIILIGGASGVGTSSMAFELASRLGIKNLISTDMIREVMRKILSNDLSPVIHKSSFNAHESIRTPTIRLDPVIEGFINHVDVVTVGIEAIIERSLKEGISIIIEGVHIVPGFIKRELINKDNIIEFTLIVENPEIHKGRFYSRCRQPWVKRSLQTYLDNFEAIRKTQTFMIEQARESNSHIINNVDVINTIDVMIDDIVEKYGGINNVKQ